MIFKKLFQDLKKPTDLMSENYDVINMKLLMKCILYKF